jgi:hypothetical protein
MHTYDIGLFSMVFLNTVLYDAWNGMNIELILFGFISTQFLKSRVNFIYSISFNVNFSHDYSSTLRVYSNNHDWNQCTVHSNGKEVVIQVNVITKWSKCIHVITSGILNESHFLFITASSILSVMKSNEFSFSFGYKQLNWSKSSPKKKTIWRKCMLNP